MSVSLPGQQRLTARPNRRSQKCTAHSTKPFCLEVGVERGSSHSPPRQSARPHCQITDMHICCLHLCVCVCVCVCPIHPQVETETKTLDYQPGRQVDRPVSPRPSTLATGHYHIPISDPSPPPPLLALCEGTVRRGAERGSTPRERFWHPYWSVIMSASHGTRPPHTPHPPLSPLPLSPGSAWPYKLVACEKRERSKKKRCYTVE